MKDDISAQSNPITPTIIASIVVPRKPNETAIDAAIRPAAMAYSVIDSPLSVRRKSESRLCLTDFCMLRSPEFVIVLVSPIFAHR